MVGLLVILALNGFVLVLKDGVKEDMPGSMTEMSWSAIISASCKIRKCLLRTFYIFAQACVAHEQGST